MSEFCVGDLQFSLSSNNILGSDDNRKVLKGTFKGAPVAVKNLSLNSNIPQNEQHWENLIKLQDEHLVSYLQCKVRDNVRYLVMELCQGSMLDYCRKTLDENVVSHIKAIDVMWQITCGLDYLQDHKIDHGDLKLENVLFWKRDSKSKRVVVKLAGYGYSYLQCEIGITSGLGCLFYSAVTKEENKPNGQISPHSLIEMEDNHRALGLDLISRLVNGNLSKTFDVSIVLRHPLFTRYTDEGRSKLIQDLMDGKVGLVWNDKLKMQKWLESAEERNFPDEDFNDYRDIFLKSETKNILKTVSDAFNTTPQLFSEYIWHIAIESREMRSTVPIGNNSSKKSRYSIDVQDELGKGTYGKVYKCEYTDGNGTRYPAACKKCNPKPESKEVFNREIETLRKLNHLFIVKFIDVVEKDSKKFLVMELCEGSLKEYVDGKLKGIRKDSLDEKILVGQVALGLAYIHEENIIHKDLKLENILLKRQSPRLVIAKLTDFGFAKELKPGKSEFSETAHPGTDTYMAPELLVAKEGEYPATFASDVYALGITIARIVLKGEHPFSSNETWRRISMVKGLVPPNLQGLNWDLIDLILKLIDKNPRKRPEMALVLRHPYFVLTNDRTKRHFSNQFWADLILLSEEDGRKQMKKIFSNRNLREWYETLSNKPETAEEIEKMNETLNLFGNFGTGVQADTLYPAKQYKKTIKEAIRSEYDTNIATKINQMIADQGFSHGLSWHRLYKLIQRAPKILAPYLWSHLLDIFSHLKSFGIPIISELEWSNLYYDEEIVDELWNIKYSENYENDPETIQDIIKTLRNCNVSERVWFAILNRIGKHATTALICSAIQSHASNAPKIIEMILQRYGITKGMVKIVHYTACSVEDWATDMMQVVLKYGGKPTVTAPDNGCTPIHYAAMNESRSGPKIMKLLLKSGGDPNSQSTSHFTPVYLAALNQGDYAAEILKLLIDSGGDSDVAVKGGDEFYEPIHFATMNIGKSAAELVDLLLKKRGTDFVNKITGMSLVHYAVFNNGECGPEIMKKLLENGASPNIRDKKKWTPLHYAADNEEYQNIVTVTVLLENGGDPNAPEELGRTPVHFAASNEGEQAYEILKLLLAYGGKLDLKDENGLTPVHAALLNIGICGVEIRKLVGANDQNANIPINNSGETLLHWLISVENEEYKVERVQLILDNGGNPNVVDKNGRSPVHYVVNMNQSSVGFAVLQLLLQKGGDPNLPDKKQTSPVHFAAESKCDTAPEKLKILLENGGDAIAVGYNGLTPLHFAGANLGRHGIKLIEILLEYGGNSNTVDNFGRSSVHTAVFQNDKIVLSNLQLLLKKGGDPNLIDKKEQCTSVHYAADSVSETATEQMKILLENGGDANVIGKEGSTPLHLAAFNPGIHGPQLMSMLLEHGGNPNISDANNRSPLHSAILNINDQSRLDIIKQLLEKGGNPNGKGVLEMTPVHYVILDNRSNSLKVLKLLLQHGGNILQENHFGESPHRLATKLGSRQYCHAEVKKHIIKTFRKMK